MPTSSEYLTTREVAAIFAVHPQTVGNWAAAGRLAYFRTPGGHRRYLRSDVERLRAEANVEPAGAA